MFPAPPWEWLDLLDLLDLGHRCILRQAMKMGAKILKKYHWFVVYYGYE